MWQLDIVEDGTCSLPLRLEVMFSYLENHVWKPIKKIQFLLGTNTCEKLCNWVKLHQIFKADLSTLILQPSLALSMLKMRNIPLIINFLAFLALCQYNV